MDHSYFVMLAGGNKAGPLEAEQVRKMKAGGTITLETMIWRTGLPDWIPLRELDEIDLPAEDGPPPYIPTPPPATGTERTPPSAPKGERHMPRHRDPATTQTPGGGLDSIHRALSHRGTIFGIRIFLIVCALISTLLVMIAGLTMVGIESVAGNTVAEAYYNGMGWLALGASCFVGPFLIGLAFLLGAVRGEQD